MDNKLEFFREWVQEGNMDVIKRELFDLMLDTRFDIVDFIDHQNDNHYRAIWLLGEGQLSLYMPYGEGKSFVELTCSHHQLYLKFVLNFKNYLLEKNNI